jgi:hypothetical protein
LAAAALRHRISIRTNGHDGDTTTPLPLARLLSQLPEEHILAPLHGLQSILSGLSQTVFRGIARAIGVVENRLHEVGEARGVVRRHGVTRPQQFGNSTDSGAGTGKTASHGFD